jgi:hypothetical protein
MQKKFHVAVHLLLMILLFNCQGNQKTCLLSEAIQKDINRIDSIINIPLVQERDKNWMKNNYNNEPSIFHADHETYRFVLNNLLDSTKVFRLEKIGNTYKVIIKAFGNTDTIGKATEFNISEKAWDNVKESLITSGFWTYPSSNNRQGLDGSMWTLEAYKPIKDNCTQKNYHRVSQWSPNDKIFVSMCKLLMALKEK